MLLQALRMTLRDWRAGELRFLLVSLLIAVAALASVGFFVDRMRTGLVRDAHQLIGADLVVISDLPGDPSWKAQAEQLGLRTAQTAGFPSMALAGQGDDALSQLASLKAVTPGYPLRGHLTLNGNEAAKGIPASGTVWVDPAMLDALKLHLGDRLRLGRAEFTIARSIEREPDRGTSFANFAPRVMLSMSDLAATQLVQNGSRVTYRLLVSGDAGTVAEFEKWMQNAVKAGNLRGVNIESLESSQEDLRNTLDRARKFLSLVSLLSAMLAAVAVAMAARRFMLRHIDACAMLRCLGLTQNQVTVLYLLEFLAVGIVGSALGAVLGFAAHYALIEWLGKLVADDLPAAGIVPGVQALVTGLVLLLGFAVPPILQLRDVPHNRVIRREQDTPRAATVSSYVLGLLAFVGLLLWQAGDLKLSALTAGGFFGCLLLFALLAWLGLRALRGMRTASRHSAWRFAVAALQRRPGATVVQVVSLALGLMSLLLLTVIRSDLVDAWRKSTPADAPNHFIVNIQPEQQKEVAARLTQAGVKEPLLYPMIRGRLVRINGKAVTATTYAEDRARRLVDREFNLSTMRDLPAQNKIVAGRWYDDSTPAASVEEGIAKTLGIHLGDTLVFDVASQSVEAKVTSLRKLDWGSMRVNFFVIINPKAMQDMPQTWVTAFRLPEAATGFVNALTRDYPNLTVIDVGSILRQIQSVVDQVVTAVEFLFLFTLASGVLVLYAALAGSQDERTREAGLLRALGATRAQLSRAQWMEFALIGGLAGLLAASGASAVGWGLAKWAFTFEWKFEPMVWLAGVAAGALCSFIGGQIGLRNVLNQPPLRTLREAY
ncbi:MAG TPA: FtsX-like permease family protein [Burkholderiaceae bacterium]